MKTNQCPHLPFAIIHLVTLIKAIYLICQIALQSPLELTGIILSPALVPGCQIREVEVKISFAMAHLLQLCWFIPFSSKKDEGRQASANLSCAGVQHSAL